MKCLVRIDDPHASLHDLIDDPSSITKHSTPENILALFAVNPTKLAGFVMYISNENSSKLNPFDFV